MPQAEFFSENDQPIPVAVPGSTYHKDKRFLKNRLIARKDLSFTEYMLCIAEQYVICNWTDVALFDVKEFKLMPADSVALWVLMKDRSFLCPLYVDAYKQSPSNKDYQLLKYVLAIIFNPNVLHDNPYYDSEYSQRNNGYFLIIKGKYSLVDSGRIYQLAFENVITLISEATMLGDPDFPQIYPT